MTVLVKGDGTSQTFQNSSLLTILNGLESSGNTHTESLGIAYIRVAPNRLLLLDVNTTLGRRLLEIFLVSYESSHAFGLRWTSNNIDYDTQGAVDAAGFSGLTVTSLANINAATLYNVTGDGVYLTQSNLVSSQGSFQNAPAEIKTFSAGNGCTLTETSSQVTLDVTPVSISFPPPIYGSSSISTAPLASTTMWGGSNHALIFVSPLFAAQTDLGPGSVDGTSYDPVRVTHLMVDQNALDLETQNQITTALASYSTTIQTMINTSIQTALDNITFSDTTVDRSVPLALSIGGVNILWSHTALTDITLGTGQNLVGQNLNLTLPASWTFSFEINPQDHTVLGAFVWLHGNNNVTTGGHYDSAGNEKLFLAVSYLNGPPEWIYVQYNGVYDPYFLDPPAIPNNVFSKFDISFTAGTFTAKIDGQTIGSFAVDSDHTFVDVQDIALVQHAGASSQIRNMILYEGVV